ncbi:uroporphyrinogen-III synthase [Galdieria sulphuraria]|uniref:Uroporphyrinogen-III synthase n=1 Tax=Galdieria sulphuraria TaxID=130081 RepID=M2X4M3_GALSU|nr:uroporphyrinogen-III synthase [Galdieria sulphuraria]EME31375.1 uroporphyrinogen-III synthase [Galdieria sulphuraria]|eukprot:XP_005707895.1 uroporphyrinogen-III synthase [Galdieria sulphuraria]
MLIEAWKLSGKPTLPLLAAVGKSTAHRLYHLVENNNDLFIPTIATGKSLAEQLPILKQNTKVYYPTSALASPSMEQILRERGCRVVRWNIYTTVPCEWTWEQQKLAESCSIVALGSPSAVGIWSERVAYKTISACIGKTTADACHKFGFKLIFSAKEPGMEGWASAIEEAVDYASKTHNKILHSE